jgi:dCMP deaminase
MTNKWDEYFFLVAETVSVNSECLSRRVGAVLAQDKSIVCTGYNGPPRGVPHCNTLEAYERYFRSRYEAFGFDEDHFLKHVTVYQKCPRHAIGYESGQGLDICPAGHAERNALINAARHGIKTAGGTLYLTCNVPCKDCMIEIINAGIVEVVVHSADHYYDSLSHGLVISSNIKVRAYDV